MKDKTFIKRLRWVLGSLTIVIILCTGIWFHPIVTIIVLALGWLALMLYMDPPERWNL